MTTKPENPAAFPCSRCNTSAVRKQGNQWLCAKHYRFGQMRVNAKRRGKIVPTHDELEALHAEHGNACQDCGIQMNWLAVDGQCSVVSLQHYRNGTLGLVCRSCNTRHAFMKGDTYCDMPPQHKQCPQCSKVKPFSDYAKDAGRSGLIKLKSWCKQCSSEARREWRKNRIA